MFEESENILSLGDNESKSYYQFSISPVESDDGSNLGVILVLRDVTKLHEVDRLKTEFVMTASHELKTPVTSIEMSLGLLKEDLVDNMDQRIKEMLGVIEEEVIRLKTIIDDLLELSRIESGKIELDFQSYPAAEILEKSKKVMQTQADEKSVSLKAEIHKHELKVYCDPNKLTWVLTNLVANGIRYTGNGGYVWVKTERKKGMVIFSVIDDGEGIPYEYQTRIFDKFVQVKKQGVSQWFGTGTGHLQGDRSSTWGNHLGGLCTGKGKYLLLHHTGEIGEQ